MPTFDEFRLLIQPDLQNPNLWSVHVQKCPLNQLHGPQGTAAPKVVRADLDGLRNSTAPPDLDNLRQLGRAVLETIMPPALKFGFELCATQALENQRGLRLVVSMLGTSQSPNGIRTNELPLEAMFSNQLTFLATDIRTPVSRGVTVEPDREPVKVAPPLRVLVVTSEPKDMPPVSAAAEKTGILKSLDPFIKSRAIIVDFCEPPTLMQLNTKLQQSRYHVVHFIGHGDFEVAGLDPNPQPHLYFEDGTTNRQRQPADVEQLHTVLRNGNVPLVVLTACSTAAQSPNGHEYPVAAFESLAQALVERLTGPSAVVAMQFDFETKAAEVFSRALYEKLLMPNWSLDEAVSSARSALMMKFGPGHRSWVCPTVYWRCKEGRVFELLDVNGPLTPEQLKELTQIEAQIEVFELQLKDLAQTTPEEQAALGNLRGQWQAKIQELLAQRGLVLGDTARLRGGLARADGTIECSLTIQLRLPATVGDVEFAVEHDAADFELIGKDTGRHADAGSVFFNESVGKPTAVIVRNASQGISWPSGEYELARLKFRLQNPKSMPIFYIRLADANVTKNGASQQFTTLNATIFAGED